MIARAHAIVSRAPRLIATASTEFAPQRTGSVNVSSLSSTWVSLPRISLPSQPASGLPAVVNGSGVASSPFPSASASLVYVRRGSVSRSRRRTARLPIVRWSSSTRPGRPPIAGARDSARGAACGSAASGARAVSTGRGYPRRRRTSSVAPQDCADDEPARRHVRRGPEPAVSVGGRGLTYGELREAAAAVARDLEGAHASPSGRSPRSRRWSPPSPRCVPAVTLVPVNPKLGRGELEHVLEDSRPDVVVGAPGSARVRPPHHGRRARRRGGELSEAAAAEDEDPALIIYTSGTTGRPRAPCSRAVRSRRTSTRSPTPGSGPASDVLVHGLPLFHVHGLVLGLLGPLRRGGELRISAASRPRRVAAALRDGATLLFGVPTMYHRLGRAAEATPRSPTACAPPACSCRGRRRSRRPSSPASRRSPGSRSSSATGSPRR